MNSKEVLSVLAGAAALMLGGTAHASGWYLMSPPNIPHPEVAVGTPVAVPTTSYKDWTNEESFDSAVACKQNLVARQERATRMYQRIKAMHVTDDNNLMFPAVILWNSADCVASDDPRLSK